MADNVENLILEHLRAIREQLKALDARADRLELRFSVVESQLAGIYSLIGRQHTDWDSLYKRVDRIERRLEIAD
jgi:uncharacterized coiled-coil protein SlyX